MVVLVVQGRGRRRGLERRERPILFSVKKEVSKKQKQRLQAFFPIRSVQALVSFLLSFELKKSSDLVDQREESRPVDAGRGKEAARSRLLSPLARRRQTNTARHGARLSLSLFERTHPRPAASAVAPAAASSAGVDCPEGRVPGALSLHRFEGETRSREREREGRKCLFVRRAEREREKVVDFFSFSETCPTRAILAS